MQSLQRTLGAKLANSLASHQFLAKLVTAGESGCVVVIREDVDVPGCCTHVGQ